MKIYLSNFSSHATPGAHGPGPKFTIMAKPRAWEKGDGCVFPLTPLGPMCTLMEAALRERSTGGTTAFRLYCSEFERFLEEERKEGLLDPGKMMWIRSVSVFPMGILLPAPVDHFDVVPDGATLCCACSVEAARAGGCHRAFIAPVLHRAGWEVVLDGRPYPEVTLWEN